MINIIFFYYYNYFVIAIFICYHQTLPTTGAASDPPAWLGPQRAGYGEEITRGGTTRVGELASCRWLFLYASPKRCE